MGSSVWPVHMKASFRRLPPASTVGRVPTTTSTPLSPSLRSSRGGPAHSWPTVPAPQRGLLRATRRTPSPGATEDQIHGARWSPTARIDDSRTSGRGSTWHTVTRIGALVGCQTRGCNAVWRANHGAGRLREAWTHAGPVESREVGATPMAGRPARGRASALALLLWCFDVVAPPAGGEVHHVRFHGDINRAVSATP